MRGIGSWWSWMVLGFVYVGSGGGGAAAAYGAPSADVVSLLRDADRARGGVQQGLGWTVSIDSDDDGDATSTTYQVRTRGDNAYVEVTQPARSRGEVFLFNDRTIWFFKPTLRKPVAMSARQKLSGQAANGDIASTNYVRDYDASLLRKERVDGALCFVLDLKSKHDSTSYDRIRYWINEKRRLGIKAEFLSLEGKIIKKADFKYDQKVVIDGKSMDFVSEMKIVDALNAKNHSVMHYARPEIVKAPESLFNVNNLLR